MLCTALACITRVRTPRAAKLFTKPRFFQPLSQNTDPLAGLHANTHLAQVRACEIVLRNKEPLSSRPPFMLRMRMGGGKAS